MLTPRSDSGVRALWEGKAGVCFYHDDKCKDPAVGIQATKDMGSVCLSGQAAKGPWKSIRLEDSAAACHMVPYPG